MARPDLVSLPFDTYQRYRLVADLVGQLRREDRPLRVLDIGGRTAILRDFLPDAEVHLVDVEPSDAGGLVLGDGSALPFADGTFDAVITCDTLEHVPAELREDFVSEACRVCHSWVVLAGPYRSRKVVESEELLRVFLREKLGIAHRYLDEHAERGLPDRQATTAVLERSGARVESIGHANLERWLALMCLSMYLDHDPQLRSVAERYYRFYNRSLYASDHAEPVYRHAVVGCLAGAPLPVRDELLAPPVAPSGSLDAFHQLVGELVAFDREKEVYQTERRRLIEVNDGLVTDLEGHRRQAEVLKQDLGAHRAKLAEIVGLNGEQEEVIQVLEQDLDGHRKSIAEIRSILEELRQEHQRVVTDLESQLNDYQAVLADLERDLSGHGELVCALQVEIEERVARQAELEAELLRVNELASSAASVEHRMILELRDELRSRFKNLKRAISPRRPIF